VVLPTLTTWERVLTAPAVTVRDPNARTVWLGELAEADGLVEVDWRGEYVRDVPDRDAGSPVELIDLVLGSPSSLVGWRVKWGAGSSSEDVRLVAEWRVVDAGDEAYVALMDRVLSDVDLSFGRCSVWDDASPISVGKGK
jgi:hypothetical protein